MKTVIRLRSVAAIAPAAALLLATTGCQAPRLDPSVVDVTGSYLLVSVDGRSVPTTITHDGSTLEVRSGSFRFLSDGTCSTTTVFTPPSGAEVSREVSARYMVNGTNLTMHWNGAGTTTGTCDGATFTMNNEGVLFRYRRQPLP